MKVGRRAKKPSDVEKDFGTILAIAPATWAGSNGKAKAFTGSISRYLSAVGSGMEGALDFQTQGELQLVQKRFQPMEALVKFVIRWSTGSDIREASAEHFSTFNVHVALMRCDLAVTVRSNELKRRIAKCLAIWPTAIF